MSIFMASKQIYSSSTKSSYNLSSVTIVIITTTTTILLVLIIITINNNNLIVIIINISSFVLFLVLCMSSRSLRSSQQGLLLVHFAHTSTKQIRAFSVVGHWTLNGLNNNNK